MPDDDDVHSRTAASATSRNVVFKRRVLSAAAATRLRGEERSISEIKLRLRIYGTPARPFLPRRTEATPLCFVSEGGRAAAHIVSEAISSP